jgi:hypothetical protein
MAMSSAGKQSSDGRHAVSFYKFTCECGAKIISESPECQCGGCGRQIRIEWRAEYQSPAPKVR